MVIVGKNSLLFRGRDNRSPLPGYNHQSSDIGRRRSQMTRGDIVVVVERSSPLAGPRGLVRTRDEELKNPPLSGVAMLVSAALRTAQEARERKTKEGKVCVLELAEEKPNLAWIEQEQAKEQVKALLSAEGFRIEERDTSFHRNVNQPAGAFMQVALKRVRREELWACWGEKGS